MSSHPTPTQNSTGFQPYPTPSDMKTHTTPIQDSTGFPPHLTPLKINTLGSVGSHVHTADEMEAFIKEEMRPMDTEPGEFVRWLSVDHPMPPIIETEIEDFIKQSSFTRYIKILRKSSCEKEMYRPLTKLLNSIAKLAHNHYSPTFHPTFINHSGREVLGRQKGLKPDLVMVEGYLEEKYLETSADGKDEVLRKTTRQDRKEKPSRHDHMPPDKTTSPIQSESTAVCWAQVLVAIEVKNFGPRSLRPSSRSLPTPQSMEAPSTSRSSARSSRSNSKRSLQDNESISSASKRLKSEDMKSEDIAASAQSNEVQLGSYLNAMRSDIGNRNHVIGCLFERDNFSIFFAGACGVVRERFNISENKTTMVNFVNIFIGLSTVSLRGLGYDNRFHPPQPPAGKTIQPPIGTWDPNCIVPSALPSSLEACAYWLDEANCVVIDRAIDVRKGLHGRCTRVFAAEKSDIFHMKLSEDELAVKIANQYPSRPSEMELVKKATEILGEGAPKLFAEFPGIAIDDGPRTMWGANNHPDAMMTRVMLLMERLYPVQELSRYDYCVVFGEILNDINELGKRQMLHRDISSGNLMYRKLLEGKVRGILNDYDRAIFMEGADLDFNPLLQKRTGTLAFLALDLLQLPQGQSPPKHILRFDLESMVYVFIWDAATGGEAAIPPALTNWLKSGTDKSLLTKQLLQKTIPLGRMEPVYWQVQKLAMYLENGRNAQNSAGVLRTEFVNETMDGHFTYERVAAIVEEMKDVLRTLDSR